jgi:hypothetical protein
MDIIRLYFKYSLILTVSCIFSVFQSTVFAEDLKEGTLLGSVQQAYQSARYMRNMQYQLLLDHMSHLDEEYKWNLNEHHQQLLLESANIDENVTNTMNLSDNHSNEVSFILEGNGTDYSLLLSDVDDELQNYEDLMTTRGSYSRANSSEEIEKRIDVKNTDHDRYIDNLKETTLSSQNSDEYQVDYKSWSDSTLSALYNSIDNSNLNRQQMESFDVRTNNRFQQQINTADGLNKLIQTKTLSELELNKQLSRVRHLVGTASNAKNSYFMLQANKKIAEQSNAKNFFGKDSLDLDTVVITTSKAY